jgi:membrane dipeptidase
MRPMLFSAMNLLHRIPTKFAAAALAALLLFTPPAAAQTPANLSAEAALERARRLLDVHPIFDGHNDLPWAIRNAADRPMDVAAYDLRRRTPGHTDLERLAAGRVGAQWWSVYVPGEVADSGYAKLQLEQIDIMRRVIAMYPDHFELALTASDVERIMGSGRIASLLGMEGGHVIENSLGALRAYYDLGARYMTLTHGTTLDWADAAGAIPVHGGLNDFGREVVREMNRLGMLVDLSHVTPETMNDALDTSAAPVMFSHSSARALTDVPRNVPDAVLRRMPENGGIVMVTFVPAFVSAAVAEYNYRTRPRLEAELQGTLRTVTIAAERERLTREFWARHPSPRATLADVADHIEHVRNVAGADHVGIGADYDGITTVPVGLEDVATYPALFAELIRRGWSDEDLGKLASGNMLRVMRDAEHVARRLQRERQPSTATLPPAGR